MVIHSSRRISRRPHDQTVGTNGDGFPDAILGSAPASVSATNGGGVYIFRGQADGLNATPAQVIGHPQRDVKFGQSIAIGDFRGDGQRSLVVAAPRVNTETYERGGEVYLFDGKEGDFFEDKPSMIWESKGAYSYYGSALAACDFNGDGYDDLAVGAYADEDKSQSPVSSNQGMVYIYLGGVLGLSEYPEMFLRGVSYKGGQWTDHVVARFGWALAAGDVIGDGACDLTVGVEHPYVKSCDDGAAYVYFGIAKDAETSGGVEETPAYAVVGGTCEKTNAGFTLAMGDIDGDDLADVLVGQKRYFPEGVSPSSNHYGTVRLLTGAHIVGQAGNPPEEIEALPKISEGGSGAQEGFWVNVGDANNDGIGDAIIGSLQDEVSVTRAGTIRVYYGKEGSLPDAAPNIEWEGQSTYERFGGAASVIGDLDGDGANEFFLFSAREDSLGQDVGRPFLVWGDEEHEFVPLLSREPAGDDLGQCRYRRVSRR